MQKLEFGYNTALSMTLLLFGSMSPAQGAIFFVLLPIKPPTRTEVFLTSQIGQKAQVGWRGLAGAGIIGIIHFYNYQYHRCLSLHSPPAPLYFSSVGRVKPRSLHLGPTELRNIGVIGPDDKMSMFLTTQRSILILTFIHNNISDDAMK